MDYLELIKKLTVEQVYATNDANLLELIIKMLLTEAGQ